MKIFLAFDETAERFEPIQHELRDTLHDYQAEVVTDMEQLESTDGLVAELSSQPDALLDAVRRYAELGKPALLLTSRLQGQPIPADFKGLSKVNPERGGVSYSREFVAVSALHVYLGVYFKAPLPASTDRLTHDISEEPEARRYQLSFDDLPED